MQRVALIASLVALAVGVAAPAFATTSARPPRSEPEPVRAARPSHATFVVGYVLDSEGHGVANASVIAAPAIAASRVPHRTIVTDRRGRFSVIGLPPGDYWFIAIHPGYPSGMTPALPVRDRLEVTITLDLAVTPA
jgi:hypothetical protein